MAKFVPLNPQHLAGKTWTRAQGFRFAARDQIVPIIAQEVSFAASEMPLGFVKEGDAYQLVALLSLQRGENYYVAPDGKWLVHYTPVFLRAYPFRLLPVADGEKLAYCVAEEAVTQVPDDATFFDQVGAPSPMVKQILDLLHVFETGRRATAIAAGALARAGVLAPWPIKTQQNSQEGIIEGIYRVDASALNKLDDDQFLMLRKSGAIGLAYGQLMSMPQMQILSRLSDLQAQLRIDPTNRQPVSQQAINEMFKLDDGLLPF